MKVWVANWLYNVLAEEAYGQRENPPGSTQEMWFDYPSPGDDPTYIAKSLNDGFELWLGFSHEWLFHCNMPDARRIAWFVLWQCWARGTWFGLKRRLWYWALSTKLASCARDEGKGA